MKKENFKHTPGPWKIKNGHNYSILDSQNRAVAFTSFGAEICDVANARLIAAAPDLLDACKHLNAVCFDFAECNANGKTEFDTDVMIDAIETMRAAIAKAGGE
jgi:hypothetical protein